MERKAKALVFGIFAPADDTDIREEEEPALAMASLPHLPRHKEEASIWKLFQTGIKPPIPGKLK